MMGRSLKIAMIVSLVLNVFLLGAIAGGTYRFAHQHTASAQQRGLRFAASELSSARQQQFRAALRQARRDAAPLIETSRDGRREIAQLLAAPALDRAALDAALARTRESDVAARARIETAVADFAATLTPDERVKLVDAMRRHGPLQGTKP
jgi:uncharacterized membrane protein